MVWIVIGVIIVGMVIVFDDINRITKHISLQIIPDNLIIHKKILRMEDGLDEVVKRTTDLVERIGFEEEEQLLDEGVCWREEERRQHLGSLFPRVSNLEFQIQCLNNQLDIFEDKKISK